MILFLYAFFLAIGSLYSQPDSFLLLFVLFFVLFFNWKKKKKRWDVLGHLKSRRFLFNCFNAIIIIYHFTATVVGHHRWFHYQFPPFFCFLDCPLGLGELQACPFPDVVFPPLPLTTLSSYPFHCALQDGFGQTWWWTGDITIPLQFASLYGGQVFV